MNRAIATTRYLDRYAAPEATAADRVRGHYDRAIVIPLNSESPSFLANLEPPRSGTERVLAVAVVNATGLAPDRVHRENATLARALRARARAPMELTPGIELLEEIAGGLDLLLVDRFSGDRRLPDSQGVGLARKIGCDVALALRDRGRLRSRFIHSTDADAVLPSDYFAAADAAGEAAALVYPFWHEASRTETGDALARYEVSLRYYVLGLAAAGSPYAFHTLGSALAVDAEAYAAVRGVPKRAAAEDFYLLSKLAKTGPIVRARSAPIRLRERVSDRVPIGTGPAIRRIARDRAAGEAFEVYDPRAFTVLSCVLRAAVAFAETREPSRLDESSPREPALAAAYRNAVGAIDLAGALERAAARAASPEALLRRIHGWLDGLRTLKVIHAARDAGLGRMRWRDALASAEFLSGRLDPRGAIDEIRAALLDAETR